MRGSWKSFWSALGRFRGAFVILGASWGLTEPSCGLLSATWGILGASWSVLGQSKKPRRTLSKCDAGSARGRRGVGAASARRKILPDVPWEGDKGRRNLNNRSTTQISMKAPTRLGPLARRVFFEIAQTACARK